MDQKQIGSSIGKIFTAEVLEIISVFLSLILVIVTFLSVLALGGKSSAGLVAGGIGMVLLVLGVVVLSVIACIMRIIGTARLRDVSSSFGRAYTAVILSLIVTLLYLVSQLVIPGWAEVVDVLAKFFLLLSTLFIINGITEIYRARMNQEAAFDAQRVRNLVIIAYCIGLAMDLVGIFLTTAGVVGLIINLIGVVFCIVAYILYLSLLSKTKKILLQD